MKAVITYREKILTYIEKEVPHGVAVEIEYFKEKPKITDIGVIIYCEKKLRTVDNFEELLEADILRIGGVPADALRRFAVAGELILEEAPDSRDVGRHSPCPFVSAAALRSATR